MQWFKEHPEASLAMVAAVFMAIIIGMYAWGVGTVFSAVNEAVNFPVGDGTAPQFNVQAASMLDFRGVSTSSVSAQASAQ